ncbi:30S ribosome-binding factor RbfA [Hirschia maritima]|uniref:30S ribosome-binding factor RbfA n=1 Tax=Hirschia maritima TaxID=1121961 RepID=UPI000376C4BD|nr:30S ribosome-binding factor RbfA [Hirschia maritima]
MPKRRFSSAKGPTQRQLRAGELIRHALVDILVREQFNDPALSDVSITVSEVRMSPDLQHATCYVAPLGGDKNEQKSIVDGLNRAKGFLRGRLGREIDMRYTPQLRFLSDDSYAEAGKIGDLLASPEVARDLVDKDNDESENNL